MQTADYLLELVGQSLKVFGFFGVVVLPATWLCVRRLTELSVAARLVTGAALGFSLFVAGAQYVGAWSLDAMVWFWLIQLAAAAWFGRSVARTVARSPAVKNDSAPPIAPNDVSPAAASSRSWQAYTLLALAAGAAMQYYALSLSELPDGVDSAFHCVVAQRQLDAGRATTDLWPLEELQLNYPIGSHLWLAVASRWTGLAIHEVFRHSFLIGLIGCGLCVSAWSERLFGSTEHAAAGAFVFVFGSFQASLFPYSWGGLPSVLAMWQALAGLYVFFFASGRRATFFAAVLWGGVALVHHHTMVAVLAGIGLLGLWQLSRSHARGLGRRVWFTLVGAGVVAAGFAVPLALRVTRVAETGVLAYSEEFRLPWQHVWSWGPGLAVVAVVGLCVRVESESRGARNFLVGLGAVWLAAFIVLDYGGRLVSQWLGRAAATPFTPSRFILDFQYVLAIFGGAGLVAILRVIRLVPVRGLVLAGMAGWAVWQVALRWSPVYADSMLPIGRWANANLPADALVTGSASAWVTYVFHRESTSLFVPISELAGGPRWQQKSELLRNPGREPWPVWRERLGKPIYVVGRADESSWGRPPIHVIQSLGMFEMTPRESNDGDSP